MVKSCAAFGCTYRFIKSSGRGFFRFPLRNPVRNKLWTLALRRKNFEPTKSSVICGAHFQTGRPSGDPEHPDYVPNVFVFKASKRKKLRDARKNTCEKIAEDIVNDTSDTEMHIKIESFCTSSFKTEGLAETGDEILNQKQELQQEYTTVTALKQEEGELQMDISGEVSEKDDELLNLKLELQQVYSTLSIVTTEKDMLAEELSAANVTQSILHNSISEKEEELLKVKKELQQAYMEVNALRSEKEELQRKLSAADITQGILHDRSKLHYYTGLRSLKDFNLISSLLSGVESNIKRVSLETQVLIVLMKLKLNLWHADLGHRFRISASTINKICITLIPPLETKLDLLVKSPVNNALEKTIPVCFKNTVYENLYQRLHRNSKSKTKHSENEDTDLNSM